MQPASYPIPLISVNVNSVAEKLALSAFRSWPWEKYEYPRARTTEAKRTGFFILAFDPSRFFGHTRSRDSGLIWLASHSNLRKNNESGMAQFHYGIMFSIKHKGEQQQLVLKG